MKASFSDSAYLQVPTVTFSWGFTPLKNEHDIGKSPSSKGGFSIAMSVFCGIYRLIFVEKSPDCTKKRCHQFVLSAPSHNPGKADRLGVDRHPFWKTHGFPTTILAKKGETVSSEGPYIYPTTGPPFYGGKILGAPGYGYFPWFFAAPRNCPTTLRVCCVDARPQEV